MIARELVVVVLNKRSGTHSTKSESSDSIISRLSSRLPETKDNRSGNSLRDALLFHAVQLLLDIDRATPDGAEEIWQPSSTEVLYSLLDLIVLEGILPFLLPGAGLPARLRPKPLLVGQVASHPLESKDITAKLMARMTPLFHDRKRPVTAILRERYLGDIIAATATLTHEPSESEQERPQSQMLLDQIIQQ